MTMQEVVKSSLKTAFAEKLYSFSILCLSEESHSVFRQRKVFGLQLTASPSAQCCLYRELISWKQMQCTTLDIYRVQKVRTSDPQTCETCFVPTPQSRRHFCHITALWKNQTRLWQAVYTDIRLPGASQYFYSLHHPAVAWQTCSNGFQWLPLPSLPCCCVSSQLDGAHGVAGDVQS